jgi:hypothetical protein
MSEGVFLDANQQKFLSELDKWLRDQQNDDLTGTIRLSRELITQIENRGYYSEVEAEVLNELRLQYIKDKKKK